MRLPRLPVSRRRLREQRDHLAGRVAELHTSLAQACERESNRTRERDKARTELEHVRDYARKAQGAWDKARARVAELQRERRERENLLDHWQHRVAELEQAIREHRESLANQHALDEPRNVRLRAVLDGHDRQERRESNDKHNTHCGECGGLFNLDLGRIKHRDWCQRDHERQQREPTRVCQVAEHAEAERIVGDLAKPNPGMPLGGGDGVECRYCESRWTLWERHALSLHDRECVWRRAVEHARPHERGDEPVTYQDGTRYRLNRRQPESTDVGPPDLPEWGYMEGGP